MPAIGLNQGSVSPKRVGVTVDRVNFLGRMVTVDRQLVTPPKGEPRFGPPSVLRRTGWFRYLLLSLMCWRSTSRGSVKGLMVLIFTNESRATDSP